MHLEQIRGPEDLKNLSVSELEVIARQIRDEIHEVTSKNGGHLASNLGSTDLILALHYVFASPTDHIVFDVGHQAYPHKLVTGRYDQFPTIRAEGGLSGFLQR